MAKKYTKEELEIIKKYGTIGDKDYDKKIKIYSASIPNKRITSLDLAKYRKKFYDKQGKSHW